MFRPRGLHPQTKEQGVGLEVKSAHEVILREGGTAQATD